MNNFVRKNFLKIIIALAIIIFLIMIIPINKSEATDKKIDTKASVSLGSLWSTIKKVFNPVIEPLKKVFKPIIQPVKKIIKPLIDIAEKAVKKITQIVCSHKEKSYTDNNDGATHKKVCSKCKKVLAKSEAHDYNSSGKCKNCGYKKPSSKPPKKSTDKPEQETPEEPEIQMPEMPEQETQEQQQEEPESEEPTKPEEQETESSTIDDLSTLLKIYKENITEIYNNTVIVPYGKIIKFEKTDDVTITLSNDKMTVSGNAFYVVGVGKITVTLKSDNKEETINFFAWNVRLKKSKYYVYKNEARSKKAKYVYAKTYFATSNTSKKKTLKIEEHFFVTGSYSGELDGKYIKSYYDEKNDKSTKSAISYSMVKKFPDIVVTKIELNDTSLRVKLGSKVETSVKLIEPENASDKTITWEVSNKNILEIVNNNDGKIKVRGIKPGKAKIIAKASVSSNVQAECEVEVYREPGQTIDVTQIELDKNSAELLLGETLKLTAKITPSYADNKNVDWVSSNNNIATVKDGVVSPIKAGTVIITARASNGLEAKCEVKVNDSKPIHTYTYSGAKKKEYQDNSIYVKIEEKGKYYITKIWVRDPASQLKKVDAGWQKDLKTVNTMLNNTQNAIVGCNGSGFYLKNHYSPSQSAIKKTNWNKTTEGYLVISNGKVLRKISGQKTNYLLGILPNGSFKYYEKEPYTKVIDEDKVRDTFTFGPLMIKDGKKYVQSGSPRQRYSGYDAKRTTVGQVDENNFIIITAHGNSNLNDMTSIGLKLDCKLLFNLDGGGSTSLWFRNGRSGKGTQVKSSSRAVGDALCFVSNEN